MENNNTQISASECKKHFLSLVDEVKNQNSSFVITKRKVPIAMIVPIEIVVDNAKSYFGFMKGTAKINKDIVNYSLAEDWEVNND